MARKNLCVCFTLSLSLSLSYLLAFIQALLLSHVTQYCFTAIPRLHISLDRPSKEGVKKELFFSSFIFLAFANARFSLSSQPNTHTYTTANIIQHSSCVTASLPRKIIDAICNHLQPHFGILPLNIFTAASFPPSPLYYNDILWITWGSTK